MRELSQLSGPWTGFWIQSGLRGSMGLALTFAAGKIDGTGTDIIGPFHLRGHYDAEGAVHMTKAYAWHLVDYRGKWDGQMISGTWNIRSLGSGAFEIWPESDLFALESLFEAEDRELAST